MEGHTPPEALGRRFAEKILCQDLPIWLFLVVAVLKVYEEITQYEPNRGVKDCCC